MKQYLKNNSGMALTMVLWIMTISMTMCTVLAVLAYNSYVSVKWMKDEKQAYYLARAGVEAASYAYQEALGASGSGKADADTLTLVNVGKNGSDADIITSQRVYAYYTNSSGTNDGTVWDGFDFTTNVGAMGYDGYFGYFDVAIGNGTDYIKTQSDSADAVDGYELVPEAVKVFKSEGTVVSDKTESGFFKQTVYAYINPVETTGGSSTSSLYDEKGVLKREVDPINAFTKKDSITFDYEKLDEKFTYNQNEGVWNNLTAWIKSIFNGLLNQIYHQIATIKYEDLPINITGKTGYIFSDFPRNRTIDLYSKITDSTLVLEKPTSSNVIKGGSKLASTSPDKVSGTQNYGDNFYVISSGENLFLQDVGIDATPEKGQYNCIGLFGDEIVIDGNITLYAYITNPDSLGSDSLKSTIALLGNRFCLGTVMLGHGRVYDKNDSKLKKGTGITDTEGNPVLANKVYFNGNVVLKLNVQGSGTETYRIFNAGDMAYFYGAYSESSTINTSGGTKTSNASGIDLLKYFVDAVIARRDGYDIYGDAVIEKMKQIREIYYGAETPSYFDGKTVLFERLRVEVKEGRVYVNDETGRIDEIIPPMPTSSSTINWGQPKHSISEELAEYKFE